MFSFLKKNWDVISKMMVNQFGMMILALMLSIPTSQNQTLFMICNLFSTGFYLCLIYLVAWEFGAKEKIRLDGGRIPYQPWKGILLSLWANVLNLLLNVGAVFGYLCMDVSTKQPIWAANIYVICNNVGRFIQPMYIGIMDMIAPGVPFPMLLIVIPALLVSFLGYYLAIRGKRLSEMIGIHSAASRSNSKAKRY